jgi:hypothetical protein
VKANWKGKSAPNARKRRRTDSNKRTLNASKSNTFLVAEGAVGAIELVPISVQDDPINGEENAKQSPTLCEGNEHVLTTEKRRRRSRATWDYGDDLTRSGSTPELFCWARRRIKSKELDR